MPTPVKTLVGTKILVQIGDGASPETFTHDCFINTDRGVQISSDLTSTLTPFCDDPELPAWKEQFKDGLELTVTGAGKLHTTSLEEWFDWMNGDTAKHIRIKFDTTGALGGGYLEGSAKLSQVTLNGPRKDNATVEVTIVSHGAFDWVDNA